MMKDADRTFPAGTTPLYTFHLVGEDGEPIPAASLATLTLTLTDHATGAIINERNALDALNENDVTVDDAGAVAWLMRAEDTASLNAPPGTLERHDAEFRWTWDDGRRAGCHRERFFIDP